MTSPGDLLARLRALSPFAADVFERQWGEIRGSWEREDWFDRIEATCRYWEREHDRLRTPSGSLDK